MDVISNETGESTRPTRFDLAVRQAAAAKVWPVFRAWLIRSGASVTEADADREDVLPELAAALEYNDDGYEVAKHLEARGWDADDELVDAGRCLLDALEDAHDAAVKSWVTTAKPAQLFVVGGEIDFAEMATTVRTPEESARVRDLKRRRDIAGGIAYDGALASGQTPAQARRAAKFAREAVVS